MAFKIELRKVTRPPRDKFFPFQEANLFQTFSRTNDNENVFFDYNLFEYQEKEMEGCKQHKISNQG